MLTRFGEFDRPHLSFEDLRRQMYRLFDEYDSPLSHAAGQAGMPHASVDDDGAALLVRADLPGMSEKDVQIQLTSDVLTIQGDRKLAPPAGYAVHRQERHASRFARSFSLPCKVDAERCSATMKDGVLTITLPKAPEAQPRRIAVKAS